MNLEKERELFEAWYLQHYYTRNGLTPDIDIFKKYHDGDDWVYLYDPAFRSWTVWLASASREGYKMVPLEASKACLSNLGDVIFDNFGTTVTEVDRCAEKAYKAMLGAVE